MEQKIWREDLIKIVTREKGSLPDKQCWSNWVFTWVKCIFWFWHHIAHVNINLIQILCLNFSHWFSRMHWKGIESGSIGWLSLEPKCAPGLMCTFWQWPCRNHCTFLDWLLRNVNYWWKFGAFNLKDDKRAIYVLTNESTYLFSKGLNMVWRSTFTPNGFPFINCGDMDVLCTHLSEW